MIYGKVTIGSDTRTVNGIHRVVNRIQETSGGVVHSLSLYGERSGGGGAKTRVWAVIYADNAGVPGALLAVSSDFYDYGTSPWWHTFTGLSYHSTINNYYWIGYIAADKFVHYYDAGVADQLARAVDGDTTPDDPFGTPTLSPDEMSCYITNLGGTQTVNPDGGEDYTSLSAWESTENGDIAGSSVTSTVNCSSSGTADTSALSILGWTMSADYDMTIQQAVSDRHSGVWDASKYRITYAGSSSIISSTNINTFVTINGLQIEYTGSTGGLYGINFGNADGSPTQIVNIENCIIVWNTVTSSSGYMVLLQNEANRTGYFRNNLGYGGWANGFTISAGTFIVDNNTFDGVTTAIYRAGGGMTATNNLIRNSSTGFSGSFNAASDYNSSDDTTAIGINSTKDTDESPWNNSGDADSDYFLDVGSDDYRPGTGDLHINVGDDLSGTFTDDCVGTDRGSGANTWDLGYFEFVAAAGVTVDLSGVAASTTSSGVSPAVLLGSVSPDLVAVPASVTASAVNPDIVLSSVSPDLSAVPASVASSVVDPGVNIDAPPVDLSGVPGVVAASAVNPDIVLGSVSPDLSAVPASTVSSAVSPGVVLGSVAIDLNAMPASLTSSAVDPAVSVDAPPIDLSLVPAAASVSVVSPDIVLGSVVVDLSGVTAVAVASVVSPTVQITGGPAVGPAFDTIPSVPTEPSFINFGRIRRF